jgi:hypothetical protein
MSESTVFVVRVWRGSEPFRATARTVDSDETAVFSEPVELLRFLMLAAGAAPAASAAKSKMPYAAQTTLKE